MIKMQRKPYKKTKLVCGVGINDVDYVVQKYIVSSYIDGKQKNKRVWVCPYYEKWVNILKRCYSETCQVKKPTYIGCTIDPEWLYLSNFIKWVDEQPNRNWENCEPDKDFLMSGNKHYGATTCVFISKCLNNFILDNPAFRGGNLIGVNWHRPAGKFAARCSDPFKVKSRHLGYFSTELEAHKAWQAKKHEYACQLAELQDDPRVAEALRQRYAPDKDWT